jgi:prevent-host-death family protein
MRTANIGTLKNQLSAYLRYVRNGEEVIVCDRNVPVARILPLADDASLTSLKIGLTEEETRLASTRKIRPPKRKMDWEAFWALSRPSVSDEAVQEAIEWAKGDR